MLPKALSLLLNGELTPMELAMMMTPVVLGGYERLKVQEAEFPAVVVVEGLTPSSSSSSALPTASGSASRSAANAFAHVGASSTFGTAITATPSPFAPLSPATADVTGMLILGLSAPQRQRIDDEESWLFELKPVNVHIITEEMGMLVGEGGVPGGRKVVVEAETYVWDGLRASLWERAEQVWSLDGFLGGLMGEGLGDGEGGEGEGCMVWEVEGKGAETLGGDGENVVKGGEGERKVVESGRVDGEGAVLMSVENEYDEADYDV